MPPEGYSETDSFSITYGKGYFAWPAYGYCSNSYYNAATPDRDASLAAIKKRWYDFLQTFLPKPCREPNPLPILARAINRVCRGFQIRQPVWRRGRWKSKA